MKTVNINYNLIFRICAFAFLLIFAWFFPDIILILFLTFVLTLIGRPLSKSIDKIKIGKFHIPSAVNAMMVIIVFVLVMAGAVLFFVPSLIKELKVLQDVNYDMLVAGLSSFLSDIQHVLHDNNIIDQDQTIIGLAVEKIKTFIDLASISHVLERLVSSTASFLFKLFAVLFITFFFLKDNIRFENIANVLFSDKYTSRLNTVANKIDFLLSRYCVGMLVKTVLMTIVLYICFLIFGIKGALLMAFIGGVTNIIPYLGPIIGAIICSVFGLLHCIELGMYADIFPIIIKIVGIFVGANIIDNWLLQPYIFSQSIKAHPIEIFLVTIVAGKIGGIAGMLLGIPVYTIVRIIVTELYYFSGNNKLEEKQKEEIT